MCGMGNGERPGRLLGKPETLFARGGIQRMLASLKIVKQLIEAYLLASVKYDQFTFTISL